MGQSYGIPGRTRDSKDNIIRLVRLFTSDDGEIRGGEVRVLEDALAAHSYQVDKQVDALHASISLLKVGDDNERTVAEVKDYCRVYNEALPFPTHNETRPDGGNHPDAA